MTSNVPSHSEILWGYEIVTDKTVSAEEKGAGYVNGETRNVGTCCSQLTEVSGAIWQAPSGTSALSIWKSFVAQIIETRDSTRQKLAVQGVSKFSAEEAINNVVCFSESNLSSL